MHPNSVTTIKHRDAAMTQVRAAAEFDFDDLHRQVQALRDRPIFFVAGAAKSGTTWVQLLLDGHPEISCRGEGHLTDSLAVMLTDVVQRQNQKLDQVDAVLREANASFPRFTNAHLYYLFTVAASILLADSASYSGKLVVGEKTPDNVMNLRLLKTVFPQARFLHVVRDVRDCIVSAWFHNLRLNREEALSIGATLDEFAMLVVEVWRKTIEAKLAFSHQHPNAIMTVRYEDLIAEPRLALRRSLDFLDVNASKSAIDFCLAGADFHALSGRKNGEENQTSFFRKGVVGDWRNHLSRRSHIEILRRCGDLMRQFGYH